MNVTEYLAWIGMEESDHVGLLWKKGNHLQTAVVTTELAPIWIEHQIPHDYDSYIAPNPIKGPIRANSGRGTESDVTCVRTLYADLDVKAGACTDLAIANILVDDISSILHERPIVIIHSGGGLQPVWCIENTEPDLGRKLLRRFGRLVRVVAQARDIAIDSVFDTARILRAPGTLNHKYDPPVEASCVPDTGAPMDVAYLADRLDEAGVYELPDDEGLSEDVIRHPDDCGWATAVCPYMRKVITEWSSEPIQDRHPWLLCQFVRLESARRWGCLTEEGYQHAAEVLTTRFRQECSRPSDARTIPRHEIRDIRNEACDRAARKTDEQISGELGRHSHGTNGAAVPPLLSTSIDSTVITATSGMPDVIELEEGFWKRREVLATIYDAALARMCSPWAVLACCVARALTYVRPNATLPGLIGGPGSLNWFAAIVAPSGGGKGSAMSVARELVNVYVHQRNLGSGEGLITAYQCKETSEAPTGRRESVMFIADEIDNVAALGSRSGSTLLGTLRSAFSGETLGFSYATRGRDIHLDAHSYRMTFVCSVQPGRAGAIMDDKTGGTPQRFMWFPGIDSRIDRRIAMENKWMPFGLSLPLNYYTYPRELQVPAEVAEFILMQRENQMRGLSDPLDGHAAFAREKFAYGLAVLDNRGEMTSEDWELSGIAAVVSMAAREWVGRELKAVQREEDIERGLRHGLAMAAAEDEKADYAAMRSDRIAGWIIRKVREAGGEGISNRDLNRAAHRRDRPYLTGILAVLSERGDLVGADGQRGGKVWTTP